MKSFLRSAEPQGVVEAVANGAEQLADRALNGAQHTVEHTRRVTDDALDALSGGLDELRSQRRDPLAAVVDDVAHLARRGIEKARDTGSELRFRAEQAGERTAARIQEQPVKSVLIAAAAGAALAGLFSLWAGRTRQNA